MRHLKPLVIALVAIVVVSAGIVALRGGDQDSTYEVVAMVPAADGIQRGFQVRMNGRPVGSVSAIGVEGDAAKLTLSIDDDYAPLRSGTTAQISWNSLIGRRVVELVPGPRMNPELPDGKAIEANSERVEVDDLVAALDAPTRARVKALVASLETTLDGNEKTLRETIETAGPFASSLGDVLDDLGQDGPAIRKLVTDLRGVTGALSARDDEMAGSIRNLRSLLRAAVQQEGALSLALEEIPSTLQAGTDFFTQVTPAVDEAVPLLDELKPATAKLPEVARKLSPVLADLRPTIAELRPTLGAADELLERTPGLLDMGTATLPAVDSAVDLLQPAVTFLRPYTPELIGFLTNWTSLFSAKNASGHFGRALVPASSTSFNSNPGVLLPGMEQLERPAPGSLVDQPWTDANGDGVR